MKIIVSSQGVTLASGLDPRFGRAGHFLCWDSESGAVAVLDNHQSLDAAQGAGIQAAMTVAGHGADAVITGHCGPKAFRVLQEAGIKVYLTRAATVGEALQQYGDGKLEAAGSADVEGHWL